MSDVTARLQWVGEGLAFDGSTPQGQQLRIESGGVNGPSPTQLVLFALAGCTSIDIVDIVQKMRVALTGLDVEIEGDRAEDHPRRYTSIRMVYRVQGVAAEDHDKVKRALALSEEKYCSVRHSLDPAIELSSTLEFA